MKTCSKLSEIESKCSSVGNADIPFCQPGKTPALRVGFSLPRYTKVTRQRLLLTFFIWIPFETHPAVLRPISSIHPYS
jgi:hypothetical protein